jgi:hypothetical protein
VKLIRCDNPFRPAEGSTEVELYDREHLLEYLANHNLTSDKYALSLNGEILSPESMHSLALRGDDCLVAMPVLGNPTLKTLAMIGVTAAAAFFAGPLGAALFPALAATTQTAIGFAIISIGGTLLVNGIASLFQKQTGASYTFDGPQTVSRSGLPIPKGYGIFQAAPNIIQSWVDLQHADQDLHDADDGASDIGRQWLNIIACFGWGPAVSLTDLRINGNDIASFQDVAYFIKLGTNDQDVVTATDAGWTILNQTTTGSAPNTAPTTDFNRIVNAYPQSQRIRCDITNNFVIVQGQRNDTQRIDVTVQFPRGVWRYDENMVIKRLDIEYNVYYKLRSDTSWTLGLHHVYTNIRQSILRQITTIDNLPAGLYDVKVEKIGSGAHDNPIFSVEHESDYFGDELWIESVQETCYDALAYPNQILLGLRIMASDQISGANIQITANVTYDTRVTMPTELAGFDHDNPALVAYDVLTDPLVGAGLDPAYINLPAFVEWANYCDELVPTGLVGTVAAPDPPFSPDPDESVAWSTPGAVVVTPKFDGTPPFFCSGDVVVDTVIGVGLFLTSGSPFPPNRVDAIWSNFIRPPELPPGAIITRVYPVVTVPILDAGGFMEIKCDPSDGTGSDQFGTALGSNIGRECATFVGQTVSAEIFNSLDGGGAELQLDTSFVGFAVYYKDAANTTATTATVYSGSQKRAVFNGIFEEASKTIWDSFSSIGIMGYATPTRIGTQVGVMLDAPDSPVQVFNVGNIFKDSYSKDYLPIEDRAEEVEVDYANADDDYKTRNPVRCIPVAEQDTGYDVKKSRVNLLGCTNTVQAYYWGTHKLLENDLLLRTHKWDSPVQAIVCRIGNVVMLQHDVPQWAKGGLIIGGTASAPILDAAYTFASGQTLTLVYPAIKRLTSTISGITGNVVAVSGYSGASVKRLVSGSLDIRVTANGASTVTVDDASALTVGMSVDLYDTEVLVQAPVTGITSSGNQSTLALASSLPAAPVPDSPYILATVSSQPKLVRIRGIKRNGDQKFSLTAIDYDPGVYAIPVPNDLESTDSGGSAGNSASNPDPTTTPPADPGTGVLNPGDPGYGGSSLPSGLGNYTQSPAVALSQTSATAIALASLTTTFSDHTASYGPHTFTITDPGSSPTWYYVTVDPATLTYFCETATTKVGDGIHVYLGSILATHLFGAHSAANPGGWPIPSTVQAVS